MPRYILYEMTLKLLCHKQKVNMKLFNKFYNWCHKRNNIYLIFKAYLEIIDYKAPKRVVKEVSMHGRLSTLDH